MSNIIFQASNIPYIYSKIRKGAKERFDVILLFEIIGEGVAEVGTVDAAIEHPLVGN